MDHKNLYNRPTLSPFAPWRAVVLKIISDSTCNLTPELVAQYDIHIAPIAIQFGEETFEEGINIDPDTFYNKIDEMGIIPTTSQPSPARFAQLYQQFAREGRQILVLTVTEKHSGTFASATMAKSLAPEADVAVFDSAAISLGTGWMIVEAARADAEGLSRDKILEKLGRIREGFELFLTPATLKYLQMSGRVGRLQGALASLLNVKPIIALKEGALEAMENVRTRSASIDRLVEKMVESFASTPINLAIVHARAADEAQTLFEKAKDSLNIKEHMMDDLSISLAVHGGPGILGIMGYPAQ
jgi:DegV family protein with EDD domain